MKMQNVDLQLSEVNYFSILFQLTITLVLVTEMFLRFLF